jgi:uncharacterized membrane protein YphA (DoxX/SURF4 family)
MDIALWIAQAMLAIAFSAAATMKIGMAEMTLSKKMPWTNDFTIKQIRLIGALEILAVFGVTVPRITKILPIMTPIAATGLCCLMIGAAVTHIRRKEYNMILVNLVLFMLAAFVAVGLFTA